MREAGSSSGAIEPGTPEALRLQQELAVRAQALARLDDRDDLREIGGWMSHDFSSCFRVRWGRHGAAAWVKIPKADIRRRAILPQTDRDRGLGREEAESLGYLGCHWPEGGAVRWVELLGYLPEENALITREAPGRELFASLRRADLSARLHAGIPAWSLEALSHLGEALSAFHRRSAEVEAVEGSLPWASQGLRKRLERDLGMLAGFSVAGPVLRDVDARLEGMRLPERARRSMTLKGLDVRNVLVTAGDAVWCLDPGRMKLAPRVADLARFVATCRILWWGSTLLFLGLRPRDDFEEAFLSAYGLDREPAERALFSAYLLTELARHWRLAHEALALKSWPTPAKRFLAKAYIDRFYANLLTGTGWRP